MTGELVLPSPHGGDHEGSRRRRGRTRTRVTMAVLAASVLVLGTAGCVDAPEQTASTPLIGSPAFCEPMEAVAQVLFDPDADRGAIVEELEAAREAAPTGLRPALDALTELEQAGVNPVTAAETGSPDPDDPDSVAAAADFDRWLAEVGSLEPVLVAECAVDLTASLSDAESTTTVLLLPPPGPEGSLSFPDIVERVRSANPGAAWLDDGLRGAVGEGDERQVIISAVDDPELAVQVCQDVVDVLGDDERRPVVFVRSSAGPVIAQTEGDTCEAVERP